MRELIKYLLHINTWSCIIIILLFESSLFAAENYELVSEWEASGTCLAIDSENNLYVSSSNRILKFSSEGELITSWGNSGSEDAAFLQ